MDKKEQYIRKMTYINVNLPEADIYDQLAEECIEMAHACHKMSRYIRETNPTPLTEDEIYSKLDEELTDIYVCLDALSVRPAINEELAAFKAERWANRILGTCPESEEEKKLYE